MHLSELPSLAHATPKHFFRAGVYRSAPSLHFAVCACIGFSAALPFAMFLAAHLGLSWRFMAAAGILAVLTLLGSALTVKVFSGVDGFVFYRDATASIVGVVGFLRFFHQPLLPYLDVTILAAGLFQAFGRIGCLLVGCCHGRPSRCGIRYGHGHAECGFPSHLVGVRLFPIQAVESLFVLALVFLGTTLLFRGAVPGTVLSLYVVGYATSRFYIEFARGDAERPYLWGFSEAQWISLLLVSATALAGHRRILPVFGPPVLEACTLIVSMLAIALQRRFDLTHRFQLVHPYHIREVAQAVISLRQLECISDGEDQTTQSLSSGISILTTSLGIRLSGGASVDGNRPFRHYSLSSERYPLTLGEAKLIARQIAILNGTHNRLDLVSGRQGIFHVVLPVPSIQETL